MLSLYLHNSGWHRLYTKPYYFVFVWRPGMWLRSQLANFSQFWSNFCHLWDQCKSSEKMFPSMGDGGLYYSGTVLQMLWLRDDSAHFSQFCVRAVSLTVSGKYSYMTRIKAINMLLIVVDRADGQFSHLLIISSVCWSPDFGTPIRDRKLPLLQNFPAPVFCGDPSIIVRLHEQGASILIIFWGIPDQGHRSKVNCPVG